MKILHLAAGNLFGGVETALLEFARARTFVPELQQEFAVCFDGRLAAELKACDVAVHTLGAMRASRPWTVWKARRAFREVLAARKFDAIMMHSGWCHALLGGVVRRLGIKIVLWGHADFTGQSWEDRLTLRRPPNWVAANSRHTAQSFAQWMPEVPCEVLYLPMSAPTILNPEKERDELRAELNLPPGTVAILQASRLEEWKGQSLLLEALSQLTTSAPWVALVAGGPQRPAEDDFL